MSSFLMSPSRHSSLSSWLGITLSPWFSLLASCSYSRLLMAALEAALLVLQPMMSLTLVTWSHDSPGRDINQ